METNRMVLIFNDAGRGAEESWRYFRERMAVCQTGKKSWVVGGEESSECLGFRFLVTRSNEVVRGCDEQWMGCLKRDLQDKLGCSGWGMLGLGRYARTGDGERCTRERERSTREWGLFLYMCARRGVGRGWLVHWGREWRRRGVYLGVTGRFWGVWGAGGRCVGWMWGLWGDCWVGAYSCCPGEQRYIL